MPNGKPGDHPVTDIVTHGLEVFGSPIDDLIREIDTLGGARELEERFPLWRLDPRFPAGRAELDAAALEQGLAALRDELRGP